MKWPWHRRPPQASPDAQQAVAHARRSAQDADALAARVAAATEALAATRHRNHFGAAVAASMTRRS